MDTDSKLAVQMALPDLTVLLAEAHATAKRLQHALNVFPQALRQHGISMRAGNVNGAGSQVHTRYMSDPLHVDDRESRNYQESAWLMRDLWVWRSPNWRLLALVQLRFTAMRTAPRNVKHNHHRLVDTCW
jgi:hypothetical protein